MIVGGAGVRLIPCDLGYINGVDSSLHFFFLEFCVDFGDFFFFLVLSGGGGLYLWVVVVGCACVWWWVFILYFFILIF